MSIQRRIWSVVIGLGLLAIFSPTTLAIERFICPDNLSLPEDKPNGRPAGGLVSDGTYEIEFNSWGWDREGSQYICHCVRNLSSEVVRIDWPAVNMHGWADLYETIVSMGSVSPGKPIAKQTDLHYGDGVTSVRTMFPADHVETASIGGPGLKLASATVAEEEYGHSYVQISYGRVFIPSLDIADGSLSIEEISKLLAQQPDLLQDVEMTFTSEALVDGGEVVSISYECAYEVADFRRDVSMSLRIDDPQIHQSVFRTDEDVIVDWNSLDHEGPAVARGEIKAAGLPGDLKTISSTMSFVDLDGQVLATLPITFFKGLE
jgi:hypothetical protein